MSSSPYLFALTLIAALGSGLVAGIFFAFSTFVMTALGRLPPAHGIEAMQSINVAVINPWFMAAFFGTAVVCIVLIVGGLLHASASSAILLLAGGALYLLGCILVTIALNVPLNNALAAVKPESAPAAELWTRYLRDWTFWNHVRTTASLAAAAAFILALL
jgi:uncharacterized membrane protein